LASAGSAWPAARRDLGHLDPPAGPVASGSRAAHGCDQLSLTAHALLAWIGEHGHTGGGGLREVYVSDPQRTAPEQLMTHLMIKVEEEESA